MTHQQFLTEKPYIKVSKMYQIEWLEILPDSLQIRASTAEFVKVSEVEITKKSGIDIDKLRKKFDEILLKETPETITKWLEGHRGIKITKK
jgi:hypothetical protein